MQTVATLGQSDNRKRLFDLANANDLIVTAQAMELLDKADFSASEAVLKELIGKKAFIVDVTDVESKLLRTKLANQPDSEVRPKSRFVPKAKEYASNCRELTSLNFSNDSICEGTIADFVHLFSDKFSFLESVLRQHSGFSPHPISEIATSSQREVSFCAMVQEKWISKNGHLTFRFEDLSGECIAIVLKTDEKNMGFGQQIMPDEVLGVKGKKGFGNLVIIGELMQPDLPINPVKKISEPLSTAIVSDIHVGSRLFLEKEFQSFLDWLNGKSLDPKEAEQAGRIKYLFVAGDTVDGIGVYPGQYPGLLIKDLHKQYETLENFLLQVPDYIEVFLIPGQHDAVRWADPQPAIPKQYLPRLYGLKNFHILPSPSWVEIEGLNTMLYHGAALHEMYGFIPTLSMSKPEAAMIEILKRRSFLANYGDKQPYAPEKKDYLLIRESPDLYFGGDMHHIGFDTYRGCTVVNSACFQSRTEYEVKQGHVPTPGIVPIVGLDSRQIALKNFASQEATV